MIETVTIVIAVTTTLLALRWYIELRRWAAQCQTARIAVAYKRKVRLQAPLSDWLAWANMLAEDEKSNGRVVYTARDTTVAILRPPSPPLVRTAIKRAINARKRKRMQPR